MGNKLAKLSNEPEGYETYIFDCPGCKLSHFVRVKGPLNYKGPIWRFDGNLERPTVSPSILTGHIGEGIRCHSFIKDGKIQFLSDCDHELKNKTVDLPDCD